MFLNPIALAFAFPASPMSGIPDEEVINAEPLAASTRAGRKRIVWPRPTDASESSSTDTSKWWKVGVPDPKKQRPEADG
jgi:hypothetical protein